MSVKTVDEILTEMQVMADCEEYQLVVQLMDEHSKLLPALVDDENYEEVDRIQGRRKVLSSIRDIICRAFYEFKGMTYNG